MRDIGRLALFRVATAEVNAVPASGKSCDRSYTATPAGEQHATAATVTIGQTVGDVVEPVALARAVRGVGVGHGLVAPSCGGGGGDDALKAYLSSSGQEPRQGPSRGRPGPAPRVPGRARRVWRAVVILEWVVRAGRRAAPVSGATCRGPASDACRPHVR